MSLFGMLGAVFRLRSGTATDSEGDPAENWTAAERTPLPGASLQAVSSTEDGGVIRQERRLFHRGPVDLTARDRVEVDGEV